MSYKSELHEETPGPFREEENLMSEESSTSLLEVSYLETPLAFSVDGVTDKKEINASIQILCVSEKLGFFSKEKIEESGLAPSSAPLSDEKMVLTRSLPNQRSKADLGSLVFESSQEKTNLTPDEFSDDQENEEEIDTEVDDSEDNNDKMLRRRINLIYESQSKIAGQEKKKFLPSAPLLKVYNNLLKGIEPNDQDLQQLNDVELMIFNCLKEKKFYTDEERNLNLEIASIEQERACEINEIKSNNQSKKRGKRVEENQKMFFKKAFSAIDQKFFKKKIKTQKHIQKRHKNYQEFYDYYFKEISNKLKIPLENFYHPQRITVLNPRETNSKAQKGKKGKTKATEAKLKVTEATETIAKPGMKSFNQTYIELILRSSVFRSDVRLYLDNDFMKEYIKARSKKLEKFLARYLYKADEITAHMLSLNAKASIESLRPKILSQIHDFILKDSKAKIPWSNAELESARQFAKLELEKYEERC